MLTTLILNCKLNYAVFYHITSGQSENVGPPLRPYTVIPTSHKLETSMDPKVVIGKPLTMWITVALKGSPIDIVKCQWISPSGVTYNVGENGIVSDEGNCCVWREYFQVVLEKD